MRELRTMYVSVEAENSGRRNLWDKYEVRSDPAILREFSVGFSLALHDSRARQY